MTYHMNMHEKQSLHIRRQHCQQMLQSDFKKICEPVREDRLWSAYGFKSTHIKCFRSGSRLWASLLYLQVMFMLNIKLTSELQSWPFGWKSPSSIAKNCCSPGVRGQEMSGERYTWEGDLGAALPGMQLRTALMQLISEDFSSFPSLLSWPLVVGKEGEPIIRTRSQLREWDHKVWTVSAMPTVQGWLW